MVLRAVAVGALSLSLVACMRNASALSPTVVFVSGVHGGELPSGSPAASRETPTWTPKEEVEVEWRGSWFPAVVLEKRGTRWLVHYEGYGDEWDELVTVERIRERRSEPDLDDETEIEDEPDP